MIAPLLALALTSTLLPAPALRLADLTGDGLADKLYLHEGAGLSVAVNLGGGRFAPVAQRLPPAAVRDLLVSDLDGDGHSDLYVVAAGGNLALLGDGTGRLVEATRALGLDDDGPGLSAERLDLDGSAPLELVLHNRDTDVIFWAAPGGGFVRDADTPADAPTPAAAATPADDAAAILDTMSLLWIDDGLGNLRKTVRFTGVNVQVVNGLRATNGYAPDLEELDPELTRVNGLGNLIVGYDEVPQFGLIDRSGSHNLVVGKEHVYSSFGGVIGGDSNKVLGPYSTVVGGLNQIASGVRSAILGGEQNEATGYGTAVLGGGYNCASGMYATAAGGAYNEVPGMYSSVLSGEMNIASGITSSVSGGTQNEAVGTGSAVVGGLNNKAGGFFSIVTGGEANWSSGDYSAILGGNLNKTGDAFVLGFGDYATVAGGRFNQARGTCATVAGGGGDDKGDGNQALGSYSAVSGGRGNQAQGEMATVGGGSGHAAAGEADWAAGSLYEDG